MSAILPERDWRCMGCQEMVPGRFPSCRKCGSQKPINADIGAAVAAEQQMALVPIAPSESSVIRELTKGEEWQCPLCKDWSYANRNTCRRCGCPRPEGATVVTAQQHQLSQGGYIGYLPDPSKVEAVSSWAKQFDRGMPAPSIVSLCASMQDPSAPYCPASSSSSSSSDSSSDSSSSDSDSESQPKKKKLKKDEAAKKNKTLDKKKTTKSSSSGSSSSDREKNKKKKTDAGGKDDKKKEATGSKAVKAKTDSDKTKGSNEAKAKPKECPKGHALKEFSTHHSSFSCSLCKKTLPKNSKMFGCRPCDYDECGDCYSKDSKKESEQDKGKDNDVEKNKENSGEKDRSQNKDTSEQKKGEEPNGSAKPPPKPKSKQEKEKLKKEKKQKKAMDVDEELERRRLQRERRKNRVVSLG